MNKALRTAAVFAAIVACPAVAAAQSTPDWTRKVKSGKSIFVMTTDGVQIEGKAGPVARDGLIVYTPSGRQDIPFERVFRVERRDSSKTGLLYGAVAGYGIGFLTVAREKCDGFLSGLCEMVKVVIPLFGAGIGSLVGWGIDAAEKGRSTVYEAQPVVHVGAFIGPRGGGITVTW